MWSSCSLDLANKPLPLAWPLTLVLPGPRAPWPCATLVLTSPGPHVTRVLTTNPAPHIHLVLTRPGPHAINAWQDA